MVLMKPGVWHDTVWADRTWPEDLWLEYGAVTPTPSVAVRGKRFRRRRRIQRIPLSTDIVLVSDLLLSHRLTVQVICDLIERLIYEGHLTAELGRQLRRFGVALAPLKLKELEQIVEAVGTLKLRESVDVVVVSELSRKLVESVLLQGKVDRRKILQLLNALENDDDIALIGFMEGD